MKKINLKKFLPFIPIIGIILVLYYGLVKTNNLKNIGFNNIWIYFGSLFFQVICGVLLFLALTKGSLLLNQMIIYH